MENEKKRNVILSTTLLIMACLCMSACTPSDDSDEPKDIVNTEQDVDRDTTDAEYIDDSDDMWEEEEDTLSEELVEEEIISEDDTAIKEEPTDNFLEEPVEENNPEDDSE